MTELWQFVMVMQCLSICLLFKKRGDVSGGGGGENSVTSLASSLLLQMGLPSSWPAL